MASRVVETAGPGAGAGGLAAIEPVEPPGLIKEGMGHDKASGGGHGDREFLLVHGARFMLTSNRGWFAVLPG